MSGKRNPGTVQYEVWITREASEAINVSAQKHGITRGEYLQRVIWDIIGGLTAYEKDYLIPTPVHTNTRYRVYPDPKPGYKGRWAMWVRARCTVGNPVPMLLTRAAEGSRHGSASALVRHHLAIAIKADTGKTVAMPAGRQRADLFGGRINEVVK